jgi:hypothetical protein
MVSEKLPYFIHNITQFPSVTVIQNALWQTGQTSGVCSTGHLEQKDVGHYRLSWGVLSHSCLHTILISGCGCKGWLKLRTCQHTSHSTPPCTTSQRDECSGSSTLKPIYKYAEFSGRLLYDTQVLLHHSFYLSLSQSEPCLGNRSHHAELLWTAATIATNSVWYTVYKWASSYLGWYYLNNELTPLGHSKIHTWKHSHFQHFS